MTRTVPSFAFALFAVAAPLPVLAFDGPSDGPASRPAAPATLEALAASAARTERPDVKKPDPVQAADDQPTAPPTPAPTLPAISSGGEIGFYNKYLWRGFVLADAFSAQPTYWVKFADSLTVSSWMNIAREQLEGPLTEHDLTVDYTRVVAEKFSVSGGWINYVFPGLDEGAISNEIYGGISHASFLNPTAKVFVDFHEGDGTYLNLSVNHSFPLGSRGFAVTPSFAIGYNHQQWIDDSSWSDANFSLKLTVPVLKQLSLVPTIGYSKSLNDDFFDDHFIGGVSLVTKFF